MKRQSFTNKLASVAAGLAMISAVVSNSQPAYAANQTSKNNKNYAFLVGGVYSLLGNPNMGPPPDKNIDVTVGEGGDIKLTREGYLGNFPENTTGTLDDENPVGKTYQITHTDKSPNEIYNGYTLPDGKGGFDEFTPETYEDDPTFKWTYSNELELKITGNGSVNITNLNTNQNETFNENDTPKNLEEVLGNPIIGNLLYFTLAPAEGYQGTCTLSEGEKIEVPNPYTPANYASIECEFTPK